MAKHSFLLVILAFILIIILGNKSCSRNDIFCLNRSYEYYKKEYMTEDGRIMDPNDDNSTTSEGQSYMLLRSVLSDDKPTFDLVYKWSVNNLKRPDNLFAWLWGRNTFGQYKIIDDNSAADADVDIAFALILAYESWGNKVYLSDAIKIANSIWTNETKEINGKRVLMPGVVQTQVDKIEINPSYFSTYAFKVFQKYDKVHDWNELVDSSYYYLNQVMAKTKTGLPPNWFLIEDDQIVLEDSVRSDFSYDAIRVFARIYLDYKSTGDKRALPILSKSKFFIDKWKKDRTIYVNYKSNGELRDKDKFIGSISLLVPVIDIYNPKIAREIYMKEVMPYLYDKSYWTKKQDYYGKNLLWFGCYLYDLKESDE